MASNGLLNFRGTNKATFVGENSNIVFDTVNSSLGIGTTGTDPPTSNLYITGNAYVTSDISVGGVLNMGIVNVSAIYGLEAVTAVDASTPETITLTNTDTSLIASGNIEVGTANLFVDTVNSRVGIGTLSPDATLHVTGNAYVSSNLEVGTANLFVDTVNSRVGVGTTSPDNALHIRSAIPAVLLDDSDDNTKVRITGGTGGDLYVDSNWGGSGNTGDIIFREASSEKMRITSVGNVGIGTATPDETLSIYKEDTTAAGQTKISSITGVFSGSDAIGGGNINNTGLHIDLDSSATGGTVTNTEEHRVWGIDVDIDVTGDSDDIRGGRFLVRSALAANGTDQTTIIYGIDAQGQHNGSAPNTNVTGVNARSLKASNSTGLTDRMIGVDAECEINTGTCTDAYGVRSQLDRNGGAVTNSYLFYGGHNGSTTTITNNYGLYVTGADKHYLEGDVGIGTTLPQQKLEVHGNILLGQNDVQSFIHCGADMALSSDNDVLIVSDSNDTSGEGAADIIFGAGSAINMDTSRNFTFAQAYPSAVPRLEHMRILGSNGRVGIGTDTPRNKLEIKTTGSTADDSALILLYKTTGNGVGIDFCDQNSFLQKGFLRYHHQDSQALGAGNCFRFSSTESSEVLACGGSLLIGVDGKDTGDAGNHRKNLFIQSTYGGNTSQNYGWWMGAQDQGLTASDNDFYFSVVRNGTIKECAAIIDQNNSTMNFTGQHRTFVKDTPTNQLVDKEGLIVSADQNEFIKMSGGVAYGKDAITINESLPVVSLSTKSNDKKCFGVLSTTEDPDTRKEVYGNFASTMRKEEGDTRVYVNSVGEGAIWVVNTNGTLESGDYITTSNVAGYGMKQDDDILHNYTVAKILMDCDFNPPTQVRRVIKKESRMVDYWIRYGDVKVTEEEYQTLPETKRKIVEDVHYRIDQMEVVKENPEKDTFVYEQREEMVNVLDEHGEFQWEETDETEKAYKIRYLDADGNITDEANAVHIAAFVGCTYHCG